MESKQKLAEMTVAQVIESMSTKERNPESIADELGVSNRTVQRKLKALGYKWSQKSSSHEPIGAGYSPSNDDKVFVDLFTAEPQKQASSGARQVSSGAREASQASQEVASASQSDEKATGKDTPKSTPKPTKQADQKEMAGFLSAYLEGNSTKKIQRNYYMQEDVLSVIDKVSSLKRSEFINDCLRQFFKDNGLL